MKVIKNKYRYSFRIIFLGLLILLAFYQLFYLYLKDNFVEVFPATDTQNRMTDYIQLNQAVPFSRPAQMAMGIPDGTNTYKMIKKTSVAFDELYFGCLSLMEMLATKSNYEIIDFSENIEAITPIIFSYNYEWQIDTLYEEMGYIIPEKIQGAVFDSIVFEVFQNELRVHFIVEAEGTGKSVLFKNLSNGELDGIIELIQNQFEVIENRYVFLVDENKKYLPGNQLVIKPQSDVRISEYLYFVNPLHDEQLNIDDTLAKSYIDSFFEYTDQVWEVHPKSDYLFGNDMQTIRLSKSGLVEYEDKETYNNKKADLLYDYYQAMAFIKKDRYINDIEFTLDKFTVEEYKSVFQFRFSLNDMDLTIEDDFLKANQMTCPLEVTVVNGKVSTFKRLLLVGEENTGQLENMTVDYTKALNENGLNGLNSDQNKAEGAIKKMVLTYDISQKDWVGKIAWKIVTDKFSHVVPLK